MKTTYSPLHSHNMMFQIQTCRNTYSQTAKQYKTTYSRIIFLLTGLEDRGLMLQYFPDVSPPSVCGIFRSGPSGTQMAAKRRENIVTSAHCLQAQ